MGALLVEVVTMVRHPAKKEHPSTLAQLASRTSAIMTFGVGAGVDPFVKAKSLFAVLIAETSSRGATKFTATKRGHRDFEADVGKQSSELEAAVARSTVLDGARQGSDRARRRSSRLSNARTTARRSLS